MNRIRRCGLTALFVLGIAGMLFAAPMANKHYTFYFVSHIGANDPNMNWLTLSSQAFERAFPNVTIRYEAPAMFSVKAQIDMLKAAIATHPDGLIVPITDAAAMDPVLREAIEKYHIPVIASNNPDYRPANERIPYLTYVGADEYLTGLKLGQYLASAGKSGAVPMVTGVVTAIQNPGQTALEARAKGMADAMQQINVTSDELAIGNDPAKAKSLMTAYLVSHKDVNALFMVASWASPWGYDVAKSLGRAPGSGPNAITILTCDDSPVALEGILKGYILASNSQQFWLQGWLPAMWLYLHDAFGFDPPPTEIVGPIVIDKANLAAIKASVMSTFGEKTYNGLILWKD